MRVQLFQSGNKGRVRNRVVPNLTKANQRWNPTTIPQQSTNSKWDRSHFEVHDSLHFVLSKIILLLFFFFLLLFLTITIATIHNECNQ